MLVGFIGAPIASALGFSLAVMAAVSLVLFWARFRRADVTTKTKKLRLFKHESRAVPIEVGAGGTTWVHLLSVTMEGSPGLKADIRELGSESELALAPSLAGRSDPPTAVLKAEDSLGLFTTRREVTLDLTLEAFPVALKRRPPALTIPLLSFGENPAGAIGSGQELYAVDEYEPGDDPRDIMWKRAASMTDETLPSRVREANVRKVVTVGVSVTSSSSEERAMMRDLVAEAIGQLGMQLFQIGTALEITYIVSSGVKRVFVPDIRSLAEVTSVASIEEGSRVALPVPVNGYFDLLIVGPNELPGVRRGELPSHRHLLVLGETPRSVRVPPRASLFTGTEDLRETATVVISR